MWVQEDRICARCPTRLSTYNASDLCGSCRERSRIYDEVKAELTARTDAKQLTPKQERAIALALIKRELKSLENRRNALTAEIECLTQEICKEQDAAPGCDAGRADGG